MLSGRIVEYWTTDIMEAEEGFFLGFVHNDEEVFAVIETQEGGVARVPSNSMRFKVSLASAVKKAQEKQEAQMPLQLVNTNEDNHSGN